VVSQTCPLAQHVPLQQLPEQLTQAAPPVPQAELDVPALQVPLLSQQPLKQLVALQTQAPLTHCWPLAQGPPVAPHTHVPFTQLSARDVLHAMQLPPFVPQAETVGTVQVLPEQQPFGQLVALQTQRPPLHV